MEKKSSFRYAPPREKDAGGALATLDYSSVTKSNKLGTCLCLTNPREQRSHERKTADLDKERRKRELVYHITQKRFLIGQVFEKGLTPPTPAATDKVVDEQRRGPPTSPSTTLTRQPSKLVLPVIPTGKHHASLASTATPVRQSRSSRRRKRRPNLNEVRKKGQHEIFPRMHFLLEHGGEAADKCHALDDYANNVRRCDDVTRSSLRSNQQKDDYLQLIRKISTYLPDHLKEHGEKLIRKMTNTDDIYRQKRELLSREREKINIHNRPEWRELEKLI